MIFTLTFHIARKRDMIKLPQKININLNNKPEYNNKTGIAHSQVFKSSGHILGYC